MTPLDESVWINAVPAKRGRRSGVDRALRGGGQRGSDVRAWLSDHSRLPRTLGLPGVEPEGKAGNFGLNAAKLFSIDPQATRCTLASGPLAGHAVEAGALRSDGARTTAWTPRWADQSARGPRLAHLADDTLDTHVSIAAALSTWRSFHRMSSR